MNLKLKRIYSSGVITKYSFSSLIFAFLILLLVNAVSASYYTPTNVTSFPDVFSFGENLTTGSSIQWKQEVVGNPYNDEIQDYVKGQVGLDENDNLVLRIDRVGSNLYDSSIKFPKGVSPV